MKHKSTTNPKNETFLRYVSLKWKLVIATLFSTVFFIACLSTYFYQYHPKALTHLFNPLSNNASNISLSGEALTSIDKTTQEAQTISSEKSFSKQQIQEITKNSTIRNFIFASILMSVILSYFFMLVYHHNKIIKQKTKIFPLLSEKKFHEARELIYNNRHRTHYRDENDTFDDLLTSLTYQFESLDKAVNLRTREMERLSLFDPLTGLANRSLFTYELQSEVDEIKEQDGILAVVMIDLDNFKRLNDSLGHQYGDIFLGKIGLRLKNATRNLGLVARLGGDEFAIIIKNAKDFYLLEKICRKLVMITSKVVELDGHAIINNCSLGVALATKDQSANDLLKNAEIAMYNAKSKGGNTFR